jgi:predicted TIM-barrel fold metal-dependent hydrolase
MTAALTVVSADDHVLEPPSLWLDRLPNKDRDVAPHVIRQKIAPPQIGLSLHAEEVAPGEEGQWADVWVYDGKRHPLLMLGAAVGFSHDDIEFRTVTYDEIRPGCYQRAARLSDMDQAGVEASLCFPNLAPVRFAGQGFLEASDKDLALRCVHAYNDFIVEEWCAGVEQRLIPLGIVPLWDAALAADEVRRNAARGMKAVTFSEAPAHLGLPSLHAGYWDPFFEACEETQTVISIHIGSSSRIPLPSPDAPPAEANLLLTNNAVTAMVDWLCSGHFVRYPNLKVMLAECQIGWIPYYLRRLDEIWELHTGWAGIRETLPLPPSHYFRSNMYATFFNDEFGLKNLDEIGVDNVLFETDYPHSDSTWPDCDAVGQAQVAAAGLDEVTASKVLRDNAKQLFRI